MPSSLFFFSFFALVDSDEELLEEDEADFLRFFLPRLRAFFRFCFSRLRFFFSFFRRLSSSDDDDDASSILGAR